MPDNVIEFPEQVSPTEAMFPTYYFADTDETAIPRLPADPDVAAGILASWAILLTAHDILTPSQVFETMEKAFPNEAYKQHTEVDQYKRAYGLLADYTEDRAKFIQTGGMNQTKNLAEQLKTRFLEEATKKEESFDGRENCCL